MNNTTGKKLSSVVPAEKIDMGGFPVLQALPNREWQMLDPFLLVHHARMNYHPDAKAIHQGIGPHPHRGFSPVTFIIEGELHHRDSRGNDQIAQAGDIQWMDAGMGIIHSERPSQALVDNQGTQEMVQIWINTPAKDKMKAPAYVHLGREDMPEFLSPDKKIRNRLVAGRYQDWEQMKTKPVSPLLILWGEAEAGSSQRIGIPEGYNSLIYLIRGTMQAESQPQIPAQHLLVFEKKGSFLDMNFPEASQFILLSGAPIHERIHMHGPFVMNSKSEILEAMRDYQMGKMGTLIEA